MSRKFTVISLPGSIDAGLGNHDEVSVEEMIAQYRQHAAIKMLEAKEILDAADEDFRVVIERGVHAPTHLRTLQKGRAA